MPVVCGSGARVYLLGGPVPFTREPLLRLSGGWWRVASPLRRVWDGPVVVERDDGDGWVPAAAEMVEPLGGQLLVAGCPAAVRASGGFLPLRLAATAARWQLETLVQTRPVSSLSDGGYTAHACRMLDATVTLAGVSWTVAPQAAVPVVCELACGRFHTLARAETTAAAGSDIRLRVDPGALTLPDPWRP